MSKHPCPRSEFSEEFIERMQDRMHISYHKYGPIKEAYPHKVNAIKSAIKRIERYLETGNGEMLVDAANFCLSPDTKILTKNLIWKNIGDLYIGEKLIGFTENSSSRRSQRRWQESEVINITFLELERFKVHLSNGKTIITSADHRWLTCFKNHKTAYSYKWTETGKDNRSGLRSNKSHYIPQITPISNPINSWEAGWISGFLDGEGHLNQKVAKNIMKGKAGTLRVIWGQNIGKTNDYIKKILSKYNYSIYEYLRKNKTGTITSICAPTGGLPESMRLLMEFRPQRLIDNLDVNKMGAVRRMDLHTIVNIEPIGKGEVVALETSSKTYIAEGYGHHNCMIESMLPAHENYHFVSLPGDGGPGRTWWHGPSNHKRNTE